MKKLLLHYHPATETAEPAVAVYHPVTGDDYWQRVSAQRLPHGAYRFLILYLLGYPEVAPGATIGDKPGCLPYLLLKDSRPGKVEPVREGYFITAKVIPEALD